MSLLALFFSTQGKEGQCKKWEDSYNKLVHLEGKVTMLKAHFSASEILVCLLKQNKKMHTC